MAMVLTTVSDQKRGKRPKKGNKKKRRICPGARRYKLTYAVLAKKRKRREAYSAPVSYGETSHQAPPKGKAKVTRARAGVARQTRAN